MARDEKQGVIRDNKVEEAQDEKEKEEALPLTGIET